MAISSATELESSLISFAGSDSTLTRQGVDKRKGRRPEGWGGGRLFKGRDYFEKFPSKGGDYSRKYGIHEFSFTSLRSLY